jgi:amidophosphoribosyltransferase
MSFSELKDKCGVFAISNNKNSSYLTMLGLHALQHRGQESCGIATFNNENINVIKYDGLVSRSFTEQDLQKLSGYSSIGHVRYSTSGDKSQAGNISNIQPIYGKIGSENIAIAHNGNLVDYLPIKQQFLKNGAVFASDIDTEVILHLVSGSKKDNIEDKIFDAVSQIKGAFSLAIITKDFICAIRDKNGIRPLCLGKLGNSHIISSESCAITTIGGELIREIDIGEILFLYHDGTQKQMFLPNVDEKFCIFEYVYFARPDSSINNKSVYNIRKAIGERLFFEMPTEADVVVPVPDSGIPSAMGYANASKIPFEYGIIRNHYVGRTFIDPNQSMRDSKVKMKHSPNLDVVSGKRIILVDDSIVRGTTSKKIVNMLYEAGAKEIHMKIASPPVKFPCFYGIDTPNKEDLIANQMSQSEIVKYLGVNSLQYITLEGLKNAAKGEKYCDACFTGRYFV